MTAQPRKPRRGGRAGRGSARCARSCAPSSTPSSRRIAARGRCRPTAATGAITGDDAPSCQQQLIELAEKRRKEAGRLRKRRPKGFARSAAPVRRSRAFPRWHPVLVRRSRCQIVAEVGPRETLGETSTESDALDRVAVATTRTGSIRLPRDIGVGVHALPACPLLRPARRSSAGCAPLRLALRTEVDVSQGPYANNDRVSWFTAIHQLASLYDEALKILDLS